MTSQNHIQLNPWRSCWRPDPWRSFLLARKINTTIKQSLSWFRWDSTGDWPLVKWGVLSLNVSRISPYKRSDCCASYRRSLVECRETVYPRGEHESNFISSWHFRVIGNWWCLFFWTDQKTWFVRSQLRWYYSWFTAHLLQVCLSVHLVSFSLLFKLALRLNCSNGETSSDSISYASDNNEIRRANGPYLLQ